ncbi:GEVED domain-containing protein [Halioglobus japonicus]|uniref:GEVED domain-containing protein n=1 Tax=Halioglobus japonicus TaxID=930805 RepID=UPI0011AF6853|nr:GEVED domain-containing protein [Halioglobus japonicus]
MNNPIAHAFDFDWGSVTWVDGDDGPQIFNDVDGSGVTVTVTVTGDVAQLTNNTPALFDVGGNDELRLFPNYSSTAQSVTAQIAFSTPVSVSQLIIKDIDSLDFFGFGFNDAVEVQGSDGVNPVLADNVTVGSAVTDAGDNINYDSQTFTSLGYTDTTGWLTTNFSDPNALVTSISITHKPLDNFDDPIGQAITISDFSFTPGSDRGDAPSTYGDPQHNASGNVIYLGDIAPDFENTTPHAVPGADAVGDDDNNLNDEDGVTFTASAGATPNALTASIETISEIATHYVCAWVDLDNSGNFSDDEGRCSDRTSTSDALDPPIELTWSADTGVVSSYARVRISSDVLTTNDFDTVVSDGEVEDYQLIYDPTSVTIGNIELEPASVDSYLSESGTGEMDTASLYRVLQVWAPALAAQTNPEDRDATLQALTSYLDPDGDGQVALLIWETLEEQGTLGFYVERRTPGGEWQSVNERMLPSLLIAPMGGQYQLVDPSVSSGTWEYRLIEQEARGGKNTYGPYELELR